MAEQRVPKNPNSATAQQRRGGEHGAGRRWTVRLIALSLVFLAGYWTWLVLAGTAAPPVLPPAGEAIQASAPFTFAVVGDNRSNMAVFEDILARIEGTDATFILLTGDIVVRCRRRHFRWFLREMEEADLQVPLCPVPGNHDVLKAAPGRTTNERLALYSEALGPRRYWFECANSLFVAFDDSAEVCTPEDLRWLDRTLARLRSHFKACFVFMHVPPRDPRPGHGHALEGGADELVEVLSRWDVTAVFASHIHSYLEDEVDGVPVYISGGGGAKLNPPLVGHHYLLCTVDEEGRLNVEKKDVPPQPKPNADVIARVIEEDLLGYCLVALATLCSMAAAFLFRRRASAGRS